jgi:hypothetical protein
VNLYGFVGNEPIAHWDFLGLEGEQFVVVGSWDGSKTYGSTDEIAADVVPVTFAGTTRGLTTYSDWSSPAKRPRLVTNKTRRNATVFYDDGSRGTIEAAPGMCVDQIILRVLVQIDSRLTAGAYQGIPVVGYVTHLRKGRSGASVLRAEGEGGYLDGFGGQSASGDRERVDPPYEVALAHEMGHASTLFRAAKELSTSLSAYRGVFLRPQNMLTISAAFRQKLLGNGYKRESGENADKGTRNKLLELGYAESSTMVIQGYDDVYSK